MRQEPLHLGLIGCGSMADTVVTALQESGVAIGKISVLVREGRQANARAALSKWNFQDADNVVLTTSADMIARNPDIVAECASQEAVASTVAALLNAGIPTVIASIGALADRDIFRHLTEVDTGNLTIASGAVGGLDGLSAARLSGLSEVIYIGRKPPSAWPGGGTEYGVIFEGSARDAAIKFPKNANVAATVALAGIGFDRTRVQLIADPACKNNVHEISFVSTSTKGFFRMEGLPSPANPKTSLTAGFSVANAVLCAIRPVLQRVGGIK